MDHTVQTEDENAGLLAEAKKLRLRVAALQEEKEVRASSLNSLQPIHSPIVYV